MSTAPFSLPGMSEIQMTRVDVVFLPRDLQPAHLDGRVVVVFDVLRATTSMAAALQAGVREIRIYPDVPSARAAAAAPPTPQRPADADRLLLCGEENCLPPAGFDLGNSPCGFTADLHRGRTLCMATTNGTRAILAARGAAAVLTGALVNAAAAARAAAATGRDVTLLCAGTGGQFALEDLIGAGAVLQALERRAGAAQLLSDAARAARRVFLAARDDLRPALAESRGGQNIVAAGLAPDIDFAARLDALDAAGAVQFPEDGPPVVRRFTQS